MTALSAALGAWPLAVGVVQSNGESVWRNGWFRLGAAAEAVGVCALFWMLVLIVAHRHIDGHRDAEPAIAVGNAEDRALLRKPQIVAAARNWRDSGRLKRGYAAVNRGPHPAVRVDIEVLMVDGTSKAQSRPMVLGNLDEMGRKRQEDHVLVDLGEISEPPDHSKVVAGIEAVVVRFSDASDTIRWESRYEPGTNSMGILEPVYDLRI